MRSVMVRYRTRADRADENAGLITRVFEELKRDTPDGLRYAAFRLDDGVSFVHVAEIDTPDGSNPLAATAAFRAFQADLKERCDEPPKATQLSPIGSYNLFSD